MMTDNPDDLDILTDTPEDDEEEMDALPDGDRQLSTDSAAIDTGTNDSDLGADVAGDIGPKHG